MLSNRDLIEIVYAAFNRRDIDTVLEFMDPAVDWPNGMEGGRVYGREQVREYWTRQWAQIDPHVEPTGITDEEDGNTIVEVHQVVRDLSGNTLMDQPIQHIYRIKDHRILRMDIESAGVGTIAAKSA